MARLLDLERFKGCPIREDDPLRWYYCPVIGRLYRRRVDVSLRFIGRGKRVLEVGYGSGTSFLELSTRFEEIHGLDTHDYGPAIKEIFAHEGIKVTLTQGSILNPPYAAGYFDAILAISILEHLQPSDLPGVMTHVCRLLRPGGHLVVGMPGVNGIMWVAFRLLGCDISKHHFSHPTQALEAAAKVFTIDRIVRQPWFAHDSFLSYMWISARNARFPAESRFSYEDL